MAIKTYEAGTIENLETGETEALIVHEAETAADLAELLGLDLAEVQERADAEGWEADHHAAGPIDPEFLPIGDSLIDYADHF